jgi:hypothetical protein
MQQVRWEINKMKKLITLFVCIATLFSGISIIYADTSEDDSPVTELIILQKMV